MHEALDLFAGAGGWSVAARELGQRTHGVENMPAARATREANGLSTIGSDVWDLTELPDAHFDTLLASPPCQAFSLAGSGAGRRALDDVLKVLHSEAVRDIGTLREATAHYGDERIGLVLTPMAYVHEHWPEYVALEQVPPVLPVWEAMATELRAHGYATWTGLLSAERYGVPQTRKRAILIASAEHVVAEPTPTHSRYYPRNPALHDPGTQRWVSMAEALGWPKGMLQGHQQPRGPEGGYQQRATASPAQTLTGMTRVWTLRSNYGTDGDPAARGERAAEEPAPTITSKADRNLWQSPSPVINGDPRLAPRGCKHPGPGCCTNYPGTPGRQVPEGTVRVTIEEAALLQSFPPGYVFAGTKTQQFLQVGNAIAPGMAKAVLQELWGMS